MNTFRSQLWKVVMLIVMLVVGSLLFSTVVAESVKYTCPMHPHYISNDAGVCLICGMDLVPVAQQSGTISLNKESVSSVKEILIHPETIQMMGVRTAPAEKVMFGARIRSYGLVSENTRESQVVTGRVAGWVERLFITAVGDQVNEGDTLFTLYSPDLISAQQDYLAALSTNKKGRVRSSAQRLRSMGVSDQSLAKIKKNRKKINEVPYYATGHGLVSHLAIAQGGYVEPGSHIAKIQGYDSIWVNVSVAEKDLQFVFKGSKATVTFPNLGNIERIVHVDYIHPVIDQSSRTGKVRLVLDNIAKNLKPGAYANVVFETKIDSRLSVPSEAILKSAEGDYVVVAKGEGRFQSQRVKTGVQSGGRIEVLQGVQEDEEIVVSGQFMIDSESSLRESFRKLQRLQMSLAELEISDDQQAAMDHWIDAALYLHNAITLGLPFNTKQLLPVFTLNSRLLPTFRGSKLQFVLEDAEQALLLAQSSITASEKMQALAQLVKVLKPWVLEGRPEYYLQKGIHLYIDPSTGFYWLQLKGTISNPYSDLDEGVRNLLENLKLKKLEFKNSKTLPRLGEEEL